MQSYPGTSSTFTTTRRKERPEDLTKFGYETPPDMPAMNRDVYKWVQSLDLSHALVSVRRDTANGFLVAEIFSRYFPQDIKMHGFANAMSSHYKKDNWQQLQTFCEKQGIALPKDEVTGTIDGVHGAASTLLEHLFEIFTGKKVPHLLPPAVNNSTPAGPAPGNFGAAASSAAEGTKTISSGPRAAQNVEFGAVSTTAVADAAALRRKLQAAAVAPA